MGDLVGESVRIERALSRPPFIRVNGKAALDEGWPSGPFEQPDVWRQKLEHHTHNVGLVMGRGLLAIDIDLYKPGAEDAWDALRDDTGLDDDTVRAISGRAGLHALYRYPTDLHVPSVPLEPRGYPSIEVKADGGYIVCAPSVHPDTGRAYSWEDGWSPEERAAREAPTALLELIGVGTESTASGHWRPLDGRAGDDDLNPADVESARLLCEHFGGHDPALMHGTIGIWRPGKSPSDGSASVTIGHIGPGVAKVWTDGWEPFVQGKVYDLGALRAMAGVAPTIAVPEIELPAGYRLWRPGDDVVPDPVLARDAYIGPVGAYLDLLAGNTEAHPAAVGIQLLASLGTIIGRRASYRAGRIVQHCNLFAAVVGPSSEGAKGVADAEALALIDSLVPTYLARHGIGGLGSGEALVRELRDDQDEPPEKRRIIFDAELSSVLKVVKRDGSILGDVLRKAFDYSPLRHSTVANGWAVATGHHIALVGSITPEELRVHIDGIAIANGMGNRFAFVWSRIAGRLPEGGAVDSARVAEIAQEVGDALTTLEDRISVNGTVHLPLNPAARARWGEFYMDRRTGIGTGITKALTGRQVVHAARLALIYAVLDGAVVIKEEHVAAAVAWCDYSCASAEKVFVGRVPGKAGLLLAAVRESMPDGITGRELNAGVTHNWKAGELSAARAELESRHLLFVANEPSGGRPRERYLAMAALGR
jgi:hypothetical protein